MTLYLQKYVACVDFLCARNASGEVHLQKEQITFLQTDLKTQFNHMILVFGTRNTRS